MSPLMFALGVLLAAGNLLAAMPSVGGRLGGVNLIIAVIVVFFLVGMGVR